MEAIRKTVTPFPAKTSVRSPGVNRCWIPVNFNAEVANRNVGPVPRREKGLALQPMRLYLVGSPANGETPEAVPEDDLEFWIICWLHSAVRGRGATLEPTNRSVYWYSLGGLSIVVRCDRIPAEPDIRRGIWSGRELV